MRRLIPEADSQPPAPHSSLSFSLWDKWQQRGCQQADQASAGC